MYDLVEVVQRSDDKARILKYYDYLILLCQKTFLSPQKFEIPYPDVLDSNPIQTGASADVYRGQHGREEVAIKEFRLSFKQADRVKKLEQVADGLHFMHQYGFAHGDLKGGNVLISDNGNALISDFGVATIQADIITTPTEESSPKWRPADIYKCKMALRDGGMSQELAPTLLSRISNFSDGGTSRWMAPERFLPEAYGLTSAKATFESDVFSFAMLAIEVREYS
ncbi:hypothetical protein H0H87_008197 [Tephrocybe sp. NHM501043]|nr:hypothetical protein H0H87_008197 [Tephrocybe sp. NHM501043]